MRLTRISLETLSCLFLTLLALSLPLGSTAWSSTFTPAQDVFISSNARSTARVKTRTAVSMKVPVLDEWKVLGNGRVVGAVKNHPTIPDGDVITTSPIDNPEKATQNGVVTTYSGSQYLLAKPQMAIVKNGVVEKVSIQTLQRKAKQELGLTGEIVGDDDRQYLLKGRPQKSTSGKSNLFTAYLSNDDGLPVGDPVIVKVSSNWEALNREYENYCRITKSGVLRGSFVDVYKFYPTASTMTAKFRSQSAIVMERGIIDLKRWVAENGRLQGKDLRDAISAAVQCLQAVHASGLVWTDMKTENFVVGEDGNVKGIDLESAIPVKQNPVDYSPEVTPPEFAKAFLAGEGPYFTLEYSYDFWSLGMMLYELATGKGYFDGKSPAAITKFLRTEPVLDFDKDKDNIDPLLLDLIKQCCQLNPSARPNMVKLLLHPYFLTTGFGPISF